MFGEAIGNLIRWVFVAAFAKPIIKWMHDEISFGVMVKGLLVASFWWIFTLASLFGIFMAGLYNLAGDAGHVPQKTEAGKLSLQQVPAPVIPIASIPADSNSVTQHQQNESIRYADVESQPIRTLVQENVSALESKNSADDKLSSVTRKPSFDCANARSYSEKLICSDPKLGDLDFQVAALFQANRTSEVAASQRTWLKQRDARKLNADEMAVYYLERIHALNKY